MKFKAEDIGILLGIGAAVLFYVAVLAIVILAGPFCLAYDLNVLLPLIKEGPLKEISMWQPAVFICGIIFSEVAIPAALVLWLLQSVGIV